MNLRQRLLLALSLVLLTAGALVACYYYPRRPVRKRPVAALDALESGAPLTLYSLDPSPFIHDEEGRALYDDSFKNRDWPEDASTFHRYHILGQLNITDPDARRAVVDCLEYAISHYDGMAYGCFEPRHGLRVTDAAGSHDFLICFTCAQAYLFSPGQKVKSIGLSGPGKALTDLLRAANVPLPKQ